MGTRVDIALYAPNQRTAERAATAAYARFAELEQIMSDYRPASELMRVCEKAGGGPVRVSRELFTVLERAREVAELSGGAFDITCGPLVRLWREARSTGELPSEIAISEARKLVGWSRVRMDGKARTAEVETPGMRLDLGGIAKGYACDQALTAMRRHGVSRAMVTAGGDIAVSGPPPEKPGWHISIRGHSGPALVVRDRAVSTSGDAEQFVEIGAKRYSHIVDPRTGIGVTSRIQATVIARRGLASDPLATACCVLGEERSRALLRRYGARGVFVVADKPSLPR